MRAAATETRSNAKWLGVLVWWPGPPCAPVRRARRKTTRTPSSASRAGPSSMHRRGAIVRRVGAMLLAAVLVVGAMGESASAQDMPDPSEIHGRALPAPELPDGTVTVRV